ERPRFRTASSANDCGISIGTNYRNRLHFIFIQREQTARVLQQNYAASGRFERDLTTLLVVRRNANIGLRPVKESKLDCLAQNSSDLIIQRRQRNRALFERRQQSARIHESWRRHFKVEPAVGRGNSVVSSAPIRHKNAVESPILLEDVDVQMAV